MLADAAYALISAQTFFGLGMGRCRQDCSRDREGNGFESCISMNDFVVASIIDFGGSFFLLVRYVPWVCRY